MTSVFLPLDSAAQSVGAEEVAEAFEAAGIRPVRTGSRGMLWLEPLAEIERDGQRHAFGPLTPADAADLVAKSFPSDHPLALGPTEEIPYLAGQERLSFARCGIVDPLSLADYEAHGGGAGLAAALALPPESIVDQVTESGLRGRGGAGFPTGIKWRTVLEAGTGEKVICCNADEGDSGTFADRMIMEGDPFSLIEGMIIAGLAVGAETGLVYLRSEYPQARQILNDAIIGAEKAGWLGNDVRGSKKRFHMEIRLGAGSYVCGEETAMLESLEGKRGIVRAKPPLPAIEGLFGRPTVVNNVLTLVAVPTILAKGAAFYREFGMGRSRGTLPFQLAGNIQHGGIVEKAFGVSLDCLIHDFGGGTASGRPLRAVQVGGPLGAYLPATGLDVAADYEALTDRGALLGHGGIVVFDDTVQMARQARFAMAFCAEESCGKCTPCRIGSVRGMEILDRVVAGNGTNADMTLLDDLCTTMTDASLCAMGGLTPLPVTSARTHFPQDFPVKEA
ncbi:NADH-ubiquinone oxidoreductase-F iron-sulfur binding region domain-containing protein [Magnetospira sp. QH-2]|uniref:NADH-ubiquinone oxidoreductase-F iron-sulfur binding region domain-containing protein n=1 Tax=Magnetospira sp. (strain QH-2) TaxID=1288970 RepID=UPI0003E8177A|nr:NADH-ubiquinone oxidoreductase-F iron-sulfur binding region domain-containing protein [Magnetospira sp. QH-2]CCQ72463.1 Putative formate dehydrogenase beta subunit FdsB [Magnetospira sp. QH-2]